MKVSHRLQSDKAYWEAQLKKLEYNRRELMKEWHKVANTYMRHLERINKAMARNNEELRKLQATIAARTAAIADRNKDA